MSEVADFRALVMSGARAAFERENNEWFTLLALGHVEALGVSEVDIQPQMGTTVLPTAAGTLSIVSDDANDTFGGTGCQTVLVLGLDADYGNGGGDIAQPYYAAVALTNGLTPVALPIPVIRQVFMQNLISGALTTSAGTITSDIDGDDQMVMRPGDGFSRSVRHTVPVGWQGFLSTTFTYWSAANDARVKSALRAVDGTITASIEAEVNAGTSQIDAIAFPLAPTADIIYRASRVGGGGTDNLMVMSTLLLKRTPS